MTLARGIYEDLSPAHKPPFEGGLAPLPLPRLSTEEHQVMCQLGVVEAIRSGTTLILEDAVAIHRYAEALHASGLRFLLWHYLAGCDFLSPRLVAAHCRCMTAEEERLLGTSGAAVAFNAAIAARRGLSPRIAELAAGGCTIALGTNNMAEDMVEVMRTALFMERVRRQDGRNPTPEEVFLWATRQGYQALGIPDAGWLAPGNRADLIVVDLRKAHLVPLLRVVSCFVHQGQGRDVEAVMVDGRWLIRNGILCTLDEELIVREADRIGRAAWQRLFTERPDLSPPPGMYMPELPLGHRH